MTRPRKSDKKIPQTFAISPYTLKELDKFVQEGSLSAFVEMAIIEKLRRDSS